MSRPDENQLRNIDPSDLRAKVFEDRGFPGDWRVEKLDAEGAPELAIFVGPNARERAIRHAEREYSEFDEIKLKRYPRLRYPLTSRLSRRPLIFQWSRRSRAST